MPINLTLRRDLNRGLTNDEGDNNFLALKNAIESGMQNVVKINDSTPVAGKNNHYYYAAPGVTSIAITVSNDLEFARFFVACREGVTARVDIRNNSYISGATPTVQEFLVIGDVVQNRSL